MKMKLVFGGLYAVLAILAVGCATLSENLLGTFALLPGEYTKALSALGEPLPANGKALGNGFYTRNEIRGATQFFYPEEGTIILSGTASGGA
ncbi:MAG: hypothetical protein LBL45_09325 [Treponema sp.]|jgi:hypothetical protein|nr:hypothetical protein [Treponema sp.]